MLKRTSLLAAAHVLAVTGFAPFAGVFSGRSGVLQFFGHLGPAMLFAGAGLLSISGKIDTRRLIRFEAYLALGAAFPYLLVDSFIIHPPFGIFDGAGIAEQQHVSLNLMLIGLAAFVLVTLRHTEVLPSIQILIAAAAFAVVFSAHEQHSAITVVGHNATIVFVVLAAVLRLLDRMFEYGVISSSPPTLFLALRWASPGSLRRLESIQPRGPPIGLRQPLWPRRLTSLR